jgi:hypothetical protein
VEVFFQTFNESVMESYAALYFLKNRRFGFYSLLSRIIIITGGHVADQSRAGRSPNDSSWQVQ